MAEEKNSILKFNQFDLELHYWAFDIDDNLFHMPTLIHMEKRTGDEWSPVSVSTAEFAIVRNDKENYRLLPGNLSFSEFRDNGPRGNRAFIEDMKLAIKNGDLGPSWSAFKRCLSEGSLFALITARGNEPQTYRGAVEWIIDNFLNEEERFLMYSNCLKHAHFFSYGKEFDRIPKGQLSKTELIKSYLDKCDFYGVSSESFAKEFGASSAANPEYAKELALDKFIEKCNNFGRQVGAKSVSIGFSDDDPKNVEHVRKYFKEKSALSNELGRHQVKLNLYKTTDRTLKGGERTKFIGGEELSESSHQAWGLEGSIVPFSKWTSNSEWLNTNKGDVPTDHSNSIKNQTGLAGDLHKKFAYKKKKK